MAKLAWWVSRLAPGYYARVMARRLRAEMGANSRAMRGGVPIKCDCQAAGRGGEFALTRDRARPDWLGR